MHSQKLLLLLILFLFSRELPAQGKYAGASKGLIGKTYTDSRKIPGLASWRAIEGSVLTPIDNPEMITVDVFQKGTTFLLLFSIKEDTASDKFKVADVLEIKPVTKGWVIKTAFCRLNKIENSWIVAWAKDERLEYLRTIKKAWRFDPDKRRIELIKPSGIDCLNEGFDLT